MTHRLAVRQSSLLFIGSLAASLLIAQEGGSRADCTSTGPFTCPGVRCFNVPKSLVVAQFERPDPVPAPLIPICPPPPSPPPCAVPPTPALDTAFSSGAQELTFKAEVPTWVLCPEFITWRVEWKNGTTWQELYAQRSIDSRRNEFLEDGKLMTRVGTPGLKVGMEHRVSVGYSCGTTPPEYPNSTCYSDPAYDGTHEDQSPKGFIPPAFAGGTTLPTIPAEFISGSTSYQAMEDTFHRPSTVAKRASPNLQQINGDGLGPDAVWLDSNGFSAAGNGSRVVAGAGGSYYAYLPQAATGQHAVEAANSRSFVEALFGRDSLNGGVDVVNFELHARNFMDGVTMRSYWMKLIKNRLGAGSQPQILIGSPTCLGNINGTPEQYPPGWSCHAVGDLKWLEMARFTIPTTRPPEMLPNDPNYQCYGAPNVAAGTDEKVWVRLTVYDDPSQNSNPVATVVVGWDQSNQSSSCSVTGDIASCPRVCVLKVVDETTTHGDVMELKNGYWRYWAHDANYRLWVIRAGSRP